MRCVCGRIRTSFSCISICNLWARLEKAPVLRRLFFPKPVGMRSCASVSNRQCVNDGDCVSWPRRAGRFGQGVRPCRNIRLFGTLAATNALQLNRRFLVRAMSDPASPRRFSALRIYNDHIRFGRQQTARRVLPAIETDC